MANIINKGVSKDAESVILLKKQWAKYVSRAIAQSLMYFNKDSELYKSYQNTSFCADILLTDERGKLHTTYCKNRWCGVCSRIKTAKLINGYLPQLDELDDTYFVTVTLPTVRYKDLELRIEEMQNAWRAIYQLSKKAKYKRTYKPFKGIKKAECTIRPNGFYHYHYHLIINGKEESDWFVSQWLKRFPNASAKAQCSLKADDNSLKEIFKYAFKSEVKVDNKRNAKRFDIVFSALRGKRTVQAFGGIKAIDEEINEDELHSEIMISDRANDIFKWCKTDWYSRITGEPLIGKDIPSLVKKMAGYPSDKEVK